MSSNLTGGNIESETRSLSISDLLNEPESRALSISDPSNEFESRGISISDLLNESESCGLSTSNLLNESESRGLSISDLLNELAEESEANVPEPTVSNSDPQDPVQIWGPYRGSKWTEKESALIKTLRERGMSWEHIARQVIGRSAISCANHYHHIMAKLSASRSEEECIVSDAAEALEGNVIPIARSDWSEEENTLLKTLRESGMPWKEVAKQMPGRSSVACCTQYGRLRRSAPPSDRRDSIDYRAMRRELEKAKDIPFSQQEDTLLIDLKRVGTNWDDIATQLGRSRKTCLRRYFVSLRKVQRDGIELPQVRVIGPVADEPSRRQRAGRPWTAEEDALLKEMRSEGEALNWEEISTQLPGRNAAACSKRYYGHLASQE